MCKTMLNSADWDYFKTLILLEILKTQNRLPVNFVCSAVTHIFPQVGTVRRKLKSFLSMQLCAWMEFPLSIIGY